jgi:hypothetical protein
MLGFGCQVSSNQDADFQFLKVSHQSRTKRLRPAAIDDTTTVRL